MDSKKVVLADKISKQYRLGLVGTGTLVHDLNRWWHLVRGKEDPYLKVGEKNDRTVSTQTGYIWALRDISFEVMQGEVLGIIGKNGAGKSTLLKILSRVTLPTSGVVKIKGRLASLLEVGTGFHPELTGRENVYLNGAILGMSRQEITRKFDEIVEFSGVQKYIDTPVKRYSSGMMVRLGFAVAAHLEPEILVVDEVLAVGDAEFQKKALGKMKDVSSSEGRTVFFVSHNLHAIKNLCNKCILLHQGEIMSAGSPVEVVGEYLKREIKTDLEKTWDGISQIEGNENYILIKRVAVVPEYQNETYLIDLETPVNIEFEFDIVCSEVIFNISVKLWTIEGECVFNVISEVKKLKKGSYYSACKIPANLLNNNIYVIEVYYVKEETTVLHHQKDILSFEVVETKRKVNWFGKFEGTIRPKLSFDIVEKN